MHWTFSQPAGNLKGREVAYGSIFRTSERLIGVTEVGLVELSGGLAKLSPLIFQSDCNELVKVEIAWTRLEYLIRLPYLCIYKNSIWCQVAVYQTSIVMQELQCFANLFQSFLNLELVDF